MTIGDFLATNAAAVFAIAGAIIGAMATLIATMIQTSREPRFRLLEKVMDRRIAAHESVVSLSHSLRTMIALGGVAADGELARAPAALANEEAFDAFFESFHATMTAASNWLRTDLVRELNLLQDYIVNLNELLRGAPSADYPRVGQILRQDFVDFSASIERLAHRFFAEDLKKLRLSDVEEWHKYPLEETHARLDATSLLTRRRELRGMLRNRR
jgi:hypothetical protein